MNIQLSSCDEKDMDLIRCYVKEFRLDDEDMRSEQFLVAKDSGSKVVGFGRLRQHSDSLELCTLGVVPEYRGRGIGKMLAGGLIARANTDLFVVCIIPDFFKKFGFRIVDEIPASIKRKVNICVTALAVEEPYFSMKLIKK